MPLLKNKRMEVLYKTKHGSEEGPPPRAQSLVSGLLRSYIVFSPLRHDLRFLCPFFPFSHRCPLMPSVAPSALSNASRFFNELLRRNHFFLLGLKSIPNTFFPPPSLKLLPPPPRSSWLMQLAPAGLLFSRAHPPFPLRSAEPWVAWLGARGNITAEPLPQDLYFPLRAQLG